MNDQTPAIRRRIDAAQIDEWRNECIAAARHGTDQRTLENWLKENGCPPRAREDILTQARGVRRMHHRGTGAKALGLGLLMCAAGAAFIAFSVHGVPVGDGMRMHSGRALFGGGAMLVSGLVPLLFGLWKTLTGSAVEVPGPPEN